MERSLKTIIKVNFKESFVVVFSLSLTRRWRFKGQGTGVTVKGGPLVYLPRSFIVRDNQSRPSVKPSRGGSEEGRRRGEEKKQEEGGSE